MILCSFFLCACSEASNSERGDSDLLPDSEMSGDGTVASDLDAGATGSARDDSGMEGTGDDGVNSSDGAVSASGTLDAGGDMTDGDADTTDAGRNANDGGTEPADAGSNANDGGADTVDAGGAMSDSGAVDPLRPSIPTPCSDANRRDCACSDEEGFTTWTWWVDDQQRCATTYLPSNHEGPLPLLISNDCYSSNGLGQCRPGSEMVEAADRFGFAGLCTTSADGNWTFGNDGVVNESNPLPCTSEDSKDITYLDGVFSIIDQFTDSGEVDEAHVFAWGFSQNAMFTAYMSFCYPERINTFWQGGSGLFVRGETDPLPQMEGVCRKSDFREFGPSCVDQSPCEACEYFPVYPVQTTPPQNGCIMMYADDFLSDTAAPMARIMAEQGHRATLLQFPDIGRGHSNSLIHWDWMVGCMEMVPACSQECSEAFVACVENRAGGSASSRETDYYECLDSGLSGCQSECAPTLDMLRVVEKPCVVDGVCSHGETQSTCAIDCGAAAGDDGDNGGDNDNNQIDQLPSCIERNRNQMCCGDNVCDGPENAQNCVVDCQ